MKKVFYLSLISIFAFPTSSCETACEILHFADMVCSKLAVAIPSVATGTAFAITTVVKNVAESTELCETEDAGSSDTEYNVKYRPDENAPWEDTQFNQSGDLVFDVYVPTSPLAPDEDTGFEPSFRMETAGQYRFEGSADGKLAVEERDEANNGGNAEGELNGRVKSSANFVIVTVVPGPDYVAPEGKPTVSYLGYKKLW